MATQYVFRLDLIVPAALRAAARQRLVDFAPEGENERASFVARLSASGNLPATHYGISTAAPPGLRNALDNPAILNSGAIIYVYNALTDRLLGTNSPTAEGRVGETWSWQTSLDDAGLEQIFVAPVNV